MSNHQQVLRIYVKLDDLRAGIKASCHCNLGRSNRRVPIERNQLTLYLTKSKFCKITQTQCRLNIYACNIHKRQGLSLSKAAVSLNFCKQKVFQPGQLDVALSHITNFEEMLLTGSCNWVSIKTNVSVKDECKRLKLHYNTIYINFNKISRETFIISLLNTCSLNKLAIYIASSVTLLSSDIIAETQLVPNQNFVNIENALSNFSVTLYSSEREFRSLASAMDNLEILNYINV